MTDEMLSGPSDHNHTIDQHLTQQHRERVQRRYGEQLLNPGIPVNTRPDAEDIERRSQRCRIRKLSAADVVREGLQQRQPQMAELEDVTNSMNSHLHLAAKRQEIKESSKTENILLSENTDDERLGEEFEMIHHGDNMAEDYEVIVGYVASASKGAAGQNQHGI